MIEHLELSVDELILDLDNPRVGSTSSQSEALASIVRLNPGHFQNLMASIRDDGLDPGDSLYVVRSEDGQDFLVLEGNRRVSALKVLSNPDVLAGTDLPESMRKPLLREATGFERTEVEPIRCVCFDDREEANDWIRRRHTGVAGGEGRITWKPLEIQRFSGDYTTIDIIDFVGSNAGYSKQEWQQAQSALGGGKSTNLTRLLESAVGQAHLGIKVETEQSRKTPFLAADPRWALKVLKRIVDDILKGDVNSRRLNRASDIEKYFASLPEDLQPGLDTTAAAPKAFKEISLHGSRTKPSQKPPPNTKPAPRTRKTLAPKRHPFDTTKSTKLGMLLKEASTLDVGKFPLSCAFVLRAVVELAVNDYMDASSLPRGQKGSQKEFDLTRKADDVLNHIVSSGAISSTDLRAFRRNLLDKRSACSIQSLNGFVHGPYDLPTADALRARMGISRTRAHCHLRSSVMEAGGHGIGHTGRYSPLRYPGGKGKLSKFMTAIVRVNGLSDGRYIEPYAGGAGIAWELLITGVVRRVLINDISPHVFAFWAGVLSHTDELCRSIRDIPLSVEEWDRQKEIFRRPENASTLELGLSCFYLNRTNRSGILNGGPIGGRNQEGKWLMDARFNRDDLIRRITKIADCAGRIEVTRSDAVEFLRKMSCGFGEKDLIYVDPPYFEKGRMLYYDAYGPDDHAAVAELLAELEGPRWVVSYDDVNAIRNLYAFAPSLRYTIRYSVRNRTLGHEVMFFSKGMAVPKLVPPMRETSGTGPGTRIAAA